MTTTVGIDTQNAIRGLAQDKQSVDFARSVAYTRDIKAPKPAGSMASVAHFISSEDIRSLSAEFPNKPKRSLVSKLLADRHRVARTEYFAVSSESQDEPTDSSVQVVQRVQPKPSEYFNLMLRYDVSLRSIINNFWSREAVPLDRALQPLVDRAVPTAFQLHYPGTELLQNGRCPYCQRSSFAGAALHVHQFHVLGCASKLSGHPRPFCFRCAEYPNDTHSCIAHAAPDSFCGLIVRYGLLLKPGSCLFCPDELQHFTRWVDLRDHLETHISSMSKQDSWICPEHSLEGPYQSGDKFRTHLSEAHGVKWAFHGAGRSLLSSNKHLRKIPQSTTILDLSQNG
jgi:hypothetical protein